MIFVYNEIETPVWSVTKDSKNKYYLKHSYNSKLDVSFNSDISLNDISEVGDNFKKAYSAHANNAVCATTKVTEIGFGNRNGAPYINKISTAPSIYERKVGFITLNVSGMELLNIGIKKGCVYMHDYDQASNTFSAIFSLSSDTEAKPAFFIVLKEDEGDIKRYVIEFKNNTLMVTSRKYTNGNIPKNRSNRPIFRTDSLMFKNKDGKSELFFPVFRPRRPATNVICCSQKNINDCIEILKSKYRYEPNTNRLILHTPANSKELKKKVDFLHKNKYNVDYVTYYLPDIKSTEFSKPAIVNTLRNNYMASEFAHVSVMSREGDIYHIY
jgi:hypothetical protein